MTHIYGKAWSLALLLVLLMPLNVLAQGQGGNQLCPEGTQELAFFDESSDIFSGSTINGITLQNVSTDNDGEPISGDWTSTSDVVAFIVKGSNTSELVLVDPATTSGDFSNTVLPNNPSGKPPAISNLRFCGGNTETCIDNLPRLKHTNDILDEDARTISNTVLDGDGLTELRFTKLDGIASVSITSPGGLTWTTTDGGMTWIPPTGTTPTEATYVLQASGDKGAYFLVATSDCGEVTNFDPPFALAPALGGAFTWEGNYPNPFRAQTKIAFQLSEPVHTTLTVYNVMGRKVATLVDAPMQPGTHNVTWDGRSGDGRTVASGVYLLRLEAGDQVATRRLTVVK